MKCERLPRLIWDMWKHLPDRDREASRLLDEKVLPEKDQKDLEECYRGFNLVQLQRQLKEAQTKVHRIGFDS